jgi:hypothetical protein
MKEVCKVFLKKKWGKVKGYNHKVKEKKKLQKKEHQRSRCRESVPVYHIVFFLVIKTNSDSNSKRELDCELCQIIW